MPHMAHDAPPPGCSSHTYTHIAPPQQASVHQSKGSPNVLTSSDYAVSPTTTVQHTQALPPPPLEGKSSIAPPPHSPLVDCTTTTLTPQLEPPSPWGVTWPHPSLLPSITPPLLPSLPPPFAPSLLPCFPPPPPPPPVPPPFPSLPPPFPPSLPPSLGHCPPPLPVPGV